MGHPTSQKNLQKPLEKQACPGSNKGKSTDWSQGRVFSVFKICYRITRPRKCHNSSRQQTAKDVRIFGERSSNQRCSVNQVVQRCSVPDIFVSGVFGFEAMSTIGP